jgi:hypothetical protein
MLKQISENELFTDLSDLQQQMVVGGATGSDEDLSVNDPKFKLHKKINTFFDTSNVKLLNTGASGPGGSLSGVQINKS